MDYTGLSISGEVVYATANWLAQKLKLQPCIHYNTLPCNLYTDSVACYSTDLVIITTLHCEKLHSIVQL